jgi:uncharacterized protein
MDDDLILESAQIEKFQRGIALFNSGEYFRAHEVWEEIWLSASGRNKTFLQGLIQLTAAFHHLSRGNLAGATSLLKAGLAKLGGFPAENVGINLVALRTDSEKCLSEVTKSESSARFRAPQIEMIEGNAEAENRE